MGSIDIPGTDTGRSHVVSLSGTSRGYCALMTAAQRAQPGRGWLTEAAARIGTTPDLITTAREVTDVAVPGFADVAAIFVPERMLAAAEFPSHRSGKATMVRRLAARLADQPPAVTDSLLPPGEVLVLDGNSPRLHAMTDRGPVVFDRLDSESAERIARRPGGPERNVGFTSFLAMPLVARGAVVGCATFGSTCATVTQTLRQHGEDDMTLVLARVRQ